MKSYYYCVDCNNYDCLARKSNPSFAIKVLLLPFGLISKTNLHGLQALHNTNRSFNYYLHDLRKNLFLLFILLLFPYLNFALAKYIWTGLDDELYMKKRVMLRKTHKENLFNY